jgi:hypothetical protein
MNTIRKSRPLQALITVLVAFALYCVAIGYRPFSDHHTVTKSAPTISIELNEGHMPIGMPWVKQTMIDGVDFQQYWAGTMPDYPFGVPTTIIEGVPNTTELCIVGTNVASYAHVSSTMFVNITGCHSLNDALDKNDRIGCYNAAATMYNDLSVALKGAPLSLNDHDIRVLKSNLDFSFNGLTVAQACKLHMDTTDVRAFRPVALIQ